ncbi:Uncharacterised protein [Chlamydia trachomatis]|nr:Uncharacterised protein [Chlamydia trachomatis]
MRVEVIVARSVTPALYVHGIVGHALCLITHQKALSLLGEDTRDVALLGAEVVAHGLALKRLLPIRKGGISRRMPLVIQNILRIHLRAIRIDLHEVGLYVHRLIVHLALTKEVNPVLPQHHNGVFCSEFDHTL